MNNNIKPEFVDNRDGNTLANAINNYLKWLAEHLADPTKLSIATGYFNPEGYFEIADQLEKLDKVQLLLGTEPAPPQFNPKRNPGELTSETFDKRLVDDSLKALAEGMEHDRNLLGFSQEIDDRLKRLIEFLETDKIEVRLYEKRFLHGKAFIFADTEGLISGSSNFTSAGLTTNMELNLGRYDPTPVTHVKNWFNDLWEESNKFDLASIYNVRYKEYEPYLIYLKVLWELYKSELELEETQTGRIPLTNFQNEGISRAESIIDKYNGVLIADGVGLGKTYIGGELIRKTVEEQRQRAILICPAALRDGTWNRFKSQKQIYIETVSYEQLTSHYEYLETEGENGTRHLQANLNDYSLVVIDEAQAFRNPGIDRAFALRKLLQGSPPKKLVLMSATPVNNSIWDIYWLLSYFIKQDAAFAHKGIVSFRNRIAEAQGLDPTALKPDHLFDILDEVTVRRTRNFVKKYFPNDTIMGPNKIPLTIQFPKPHVTRIEYDLESMMPGLLSDFEEKVMPENGEPELTLARYFPGKFHKYESGGSEPGLVALMRSMLLKRLESSPYAFANTLKKIITNHQTFLDGVDKGIILTKQDIHEWQETDNDESSDLLSENNERESADDYDIPSLVASVKYDIGILNGFLNLSEPINRNEDTKLESLVNSLKGIAIRASNDGIGDKDKRDKRKVVIFSYFADTVDWISEHLSQVINSDPELNMYKERLITLGGNNSSKYSREQSIFGFVPESTEAPEGSDKDLFDIMVTTDVLAEGQNLQQCQNIINYDLPWNPMRLVQRHGRIDRIGSPHSDVYIGCVFPDKDLEKLLSLENRIRQKLARAAATIGVESEVIPEGAVGEIVYAKEIKEIKALGQGETGLFENAGEDVNAHSGEEYRQELRKGIESNGNLIKQLPWAAGSGFKTTEGEGHFFCCKVGDRLYLRFVPFETDEVVTNTLECLKFISCTDTTTRYISAEMQNGVYDAWDKARNSVFKEWQYLTDPVNLQPKIRPLFIKIAEHLRKYPPKEVNQDKLDQTVDALEAPYSLRIERELRNTFNIADKSPVEISHLIYDKVINLGLEPFNPPDPLPPIDESEVKLVCWMALSKE